MSKQEKAPYRGILVMMVTLCIPSALLTGIFYYVIMLWQPSFGVELNLASAKFLGCGCGMLFHFSCWLLGVFRESTDIVKHRWKEFLTDLPISPSLAFKWYWEDIKTNGLTLWLELGVVLLNAWLAIGGLFDFMALNG